MYNLQLDHLENMSTDEYEKYKRKADFSDREEEDNAESRRRIESEVDIEQKKKRRYQSVYSRIATIFDSLGNVLWFLLALCRDTVHTLAVYIWSS